MHSRVVTRQFSNKIPPQLAHPRNGAVLEPTNVGTLQKNPRAHKNKIGTPPPPNPPPKKEEFYGHGFSCRKNALFPGVHKIGAAISGPRIADTNFTDTGIFLNTPNLSHFATRGKLSSDFPETFGEFSSRTPDSSRRQPQPSRVFRFSCFIVVAFVSSDRSHMRPRLPRESFRVILNL